MKTSVIRSAQERIECLEQRMEKIKLYSPEWWYFWGFTGALDWIILALTREESNEEALDKCKLT